MSNDLCDSCARKLTDGSCDFAADVIYADQRPDVACPAYLQILDIDGPTYQSFKCPVCERPLRNTGFGELETEIERRESAVTVECAPVDIGTMHPGLVLHIRHGERKEDSTSVY